MQPTGGTPLCRHRAVELFNNLISKMKRKLNDRIREIMNVEYSVVGDKILLTIVKKLFNDIFKRKLRFEECLPHTL